MIGVNINTSDPKRWTSFKNSKEFLDFHHYCKLMMSDVASANSFNPRRYIDANVLGQIQLSLISAGYEELSDSFPSDKDTLLSTLDILKRTYFTSSDKRLDRIDILQRRDEVLLPAIRAYNPTDSHNSMKNGFCYVMVLPRRS
jgi:hypothetical protein